MITEEYRAAKIVLQLSYSLGVATNFNEWCYI